MFSAKALFSISLSEGLRNGKLIFSGNYKDGEMHGIQEYYDLVDKNSEPNGMKTGSFEYSFGKKMGSSRNGFGMEN